MGILSSIGAPAGLTDFLAAHRGALMDFGAGLASGPTLAQGIALGTQGLNTGTQADNAYATAQKQEAQRQDAINQTVKYLQSNPAFADLVPLAQSGQGAAALSEAFKRSDPSNALDMQYKQTQIDALKNKEQPLINAGNGEIYDPNSKSWVAPPPTAAAPADALPVVTFDSNGLPDKTQQDAFLKSLSPADATLVKGFADYQLDPTKVASLRGNDRARLLALTQQYDPTFDMSQFGARTAMRKSITSGNYSQSLNSANLVIQHLDELKKAGEALGNHDGLGTLLNGPTNAIKGMTGDPTITRFNEAKQAVGTELAKVFKGTGVSDVQAIEDWQRTFDASNSPEQLQQAIATAVTLLKSRIDTIQNQYQSAMGKPVNFAYLTPHSRQVLTDLGIDPTLLDPSSASAGGAPSITGTPASPASPAGQNTTSTGVNWSFTP